MVKTNADNSLEPCKAQFVAKRYSQQHGLDYTETFNPVIKATILRTVLALVVSNHWPLQQLEISNTFLNSTINEDILYVAASRQH